MVLRARKILRQKFNIKKINLHKNERWFKEIFIHRKFLKDSLLHENIEISLGWQNEGINKKK
jgi:hypothetical protein